MNYFGINLGHDASLVGLDKDGKVFFYAQAERYDNRIKGYENNLMPIFKNFSNLKISKEDMVVVCPCFLRQTSGEGKSYPIKDYDELIVRSCDKNYANKRIVFDKLIPKLVLDHHLSHAISSWMFRENDEEKFFMSYDGCGPWANEHEPYKSSLVGFINKNEFSIIYDHEIIPSSMPFNHLLGKRSAGKLMGLAGYLPESKNQLTQDEFLSWLDLTCRSNFVFHKLFPINKNPNKEDLILFSKIYNHYINFIWDKLKNNIDKFSKNKEVLIGGGTSLALELNTKIFNYCNNLTFGPPADDSGLALGAAAFGYFHVNKIWPNSISSASLNNLVYDLKKKGPQEPKEIANLIFKNKIIGLLRGKAEVGPRALGFRSIFAGAIDFDNLKRVSQDLKDREAYRPLAPIVTEQSFDKYFIGPKGKYMQYKCLCTDYCKKNLPAIVHKDYSARPQVIYESQDPWLHEILVEYGKMSGHECFINTSLNGKNKPICNSFEDAESDFNNKQIEIISIPTELKNSKTFM